MFIRTEKKTQQIKPIDLQFIFICNSVALEKNKANIIFTHSPQTPY